mmetsp:Transcript_17144/g.37165  ORF Transcript_17144/g.37165 Transcript_17144/m.37165 type:complete len:346 (-) Transcript_17144:136-1173(-)
MPPKKGGADAKGKAAEAPKAPEPPREPTPPPPEPPKPKRPPPPGVSWNALLRFLFPLELEHPESLCRLELFARFGPVDSEGRLRGGVRGSHVHSNFEIRQMLQNETQQALFSVVEKPRSSAEIIVEQALPRAIAEVYSQTEVRNLLKDVQLDDNGDMKFSEMQKVILDNRRRRLKAILHQDCPTAAKSLGTGRVPFQSTASDALFLGLTQRRLNEQEEAFLKDKRLGRYTTLLASLEDQNKATAIIANLTLMRPVGRTDDRWDRYCCLRKQGKPSYVQGPSRPPENAPSASMTPRPPPPRTPREGSSSAMPQTARGSRHPVARHVSAVQALRQQPGLPSVPYSAR